MGTNASTVTAADNGTAEDHRFAELAARTGLEPELGRRYAADPVAVLAEFGLSAAEAPYGGVPDPVAILAEFGLCASESLYMDGPVVIEDLERADACGLVGPTLACCRSEALSAPAGTVGA